eukprot:1156156-Pelagomonas_calceolata.AAC.7
MHAAIWLAQSFLVYRGDLPLNTDLPLASQKDVINGKDVGAADCGMGRGPQAYAVRVLCKFSIDLLEKEAHQYTHLLFYFKLQEKNLAGTLNRP